MQSKYDLWDNGQVVGHVSVEVSAVHCRICCRYSSGKKIMQRLLMKNGDQCMDLGICVPHADGFGTEKVIPAKYIFGGDLQFLLIEHAPQGKDFYPIYENAPFEKLHILSDARFVRRNGMAGVMIQKVHFTP